MTKQEWIEILPWIIAFLLGWVIGVDDYKEIIEKKEIAVISTAIDWIR